MPLKVLAFNSSLKLCLCYCPEANRSPLESCKTITFIIHKYPKINIELLRTFWITYWGFVSQFMWPRALTWHGVHLREQSECLSSPFCKLVTIHIQIIQYKQHLTILTPWNKLYQFLSPLICAICDTMGLNFHFLRYTGWAFAHHSYK